jgi:iron uptake system component EfeO
VSKRWLVGVLAASALALSACGDDDGGSVRNVDGEDCPSASASASASAASGSGSASGAGSGSASGSTGCPSASGSGSATGLSSSDVAGETDNELVLTAVDEYKGYVVEQVDELVTATKTFTDAVRAGDVAAAQAAYAPSRVSWERIEPIAGLIEDIDVAVDARVDDFEGPDDPTWTGWHRLEYHLWELNSTEGTAEFADKLDADLASLQASLPDLELPPATLPVGAAELIEEVSEGKITGEEDRYSHTDLWDFAANVEGSEQLIVFLTPAIEAEDPDLLASINAGFADIEAQLATYADGSGGYVSYEQLTEDDKAQMQATLAELSENVSQVAGVLGLE